MADVAVLVVALSAAFGLGWMTGAAWYRAALHRVLRTSGAARTVPPITAATLGALLDADRAP